jgi:hypothetical protein
VRYRAWAAAYDVRRQAGERQEPADGHPLEENRRTERSTSPGEASPSYAPVLSRPMTSTTYSIERVHPDFIDAILEFGAGDTVRSRKVRLLGSREVEARQRVIAVERIP